MVEQWRPIAGYEEYYEVSDLGRIRSKDRVVSRVIRGKVLKCSPDDKGYPRVRLFKDGEFRQAGVHQIICETFGGHRPVATEVAHNDGNPGNAAAANVRWASQSENAKDRHRHGTQVRGEQNGRAKLTKADVQIIRAVPRRGKVKPLCDRFGVSRATIDAVRAGRIWKS